MDAAIKQRFSGLIDHVHSTPVPVEKRPSREEAEAAVRALIAIATATADGRLPGA